jgi:hypothetical protein
VGISRTVLDSARQAVTEGSGWPSLDAAFLHFKALVVAHSFAGAVAEGAAPGRALFTRPQVSALTAFVTSR